MPLAKVLSCAVVGLQGRIVEVEVDVGGMGVPSLTIVGLPDAAVRESGERVRAALKNSGCALPPRKIVINLAPADLRKEGPSFDLPIAVGLLLVAHGIAADLHDSVFIGELSLDGTLRHTRGVLPMAGSAREHGITTVYVPEEDAPEAALVEGLRVIPVRSLAQIAEHLAQIAPIPPLEGGLPREAAAFEWDGTDLADVRGQEHVKRGLEVAAAGSHNLLINGTQHLHLGLLVRCLGESTPARLR